LLFFLVSVFYVSLHKNPSKEFFACVPKLSKHVQVKKKKKHHQKGEKEGLWCFLFYLLLVLRSLP
jgi:hypothetical protein